MKSLGLYKITANTSVVVKDIKKNNLHTSVYTDVITNGVVVNTSYNRVYFEKKSGKAYFNKLGHKLYLDDIMNKE